MEQLMQQIFDFFSVAGRETALFIVSMIPLIELRGSIPLGAAMGSHTGIGLRHYDSNQPFVGDHLCKIR